VQGDGEWHDGGGDQYERQHRDPFGGRADGQQVGRAPSPTSPTGALFEHAYRRRLVYRALCGRQGGDIVHRHLHRLIGGLLREHLRPHLTAAGSDLPVDVVAEFYTSAALGLRTWWVDHNFRPGPARMAHMYQRLAAPGILAALRPDHGRHV
jgi:hypothetical protein